jgi:hypothetical protein
LASLSIAEGLPEGIHTVKISVHLEPPDKSKILSERHEQMDDPKRFEGIAWYAGALLLVGELME